MVYVLKHDCDMYYRSAGRYGEFTKRKNIEDATKFMTAEAADRERKKNFSVWDQCQWDIKDYNEEINKEPKPKPMLKKDDEAEFKKRYKKQFPSATKTFLNNIWKDMQDAGIAEKPLQPGPYWIKLNEWSKWEIADYQPGDGTTACPWTLLYDDRLAEPYLIGPRINPPKE